jgi:tetratricopeptide (TPR) repeat protein
VGRRTSNRRGSPRPAKQRRKESGSHREFQAALAAGDRGKLDALEAHYLELARQPEGDRATAWHRAAIIALATRRPDEARAWVEKALSLRPSADFHNTAGTIHSSRGDFARAVTAYTQAIALAPDVYETRLNLGRCLLQLDDPRALEHLRHAVRLKPDEGLAWFLLSLSLQQVGDLTEATECLQTILQHVPGFAEAHLELGRIESLRGRVKEALTRYEKAIGLGTLAIDDELSLHHMVAELGEIEQSAGGYRDVRRRHPRCLRALTQLANLVGSELSGEELEELQTLADDSDRLAPDERARVHFSLVRIFDERGAYEDAALHARLANRAQHDDLARRNQVYRPSTHRRFVDQQMEVFTSDHFAGRPEQHGATNRPIFIVGLPRSGTSLVEQVLASHSQVFGAGELTLIGKNLRAVHQGSDGFATPEEWLRQAPESEIKALATQYLERVGQLDSRTSRVTDKLPENYLYLGWIATLFPGAVVIHCVRDTRDVALSSWLNRMVRLPWSTDLEHITDRISEYRRLMSWWDQVLPSPPIRVDYEELVAEPEPVSRRLVEACGLAWDPACLSFHRTRRRVGTASLAQVRRPVNRRSVGRWRRYAPLISLDGAPLESDHPLSE